MVTEEWPTPFQRKIMDRIEIQNARLRRVQQEALAAEDVEPDEPSNPPYDPRD